jgi:rhodanese-related sulfurtransferase
MRKTAVRAGLIILFGVILGLAGNAVSPRGIPLIRPPKQQPKPEEYILLEKAKELWDSGTAIFLDAREPADYAAGHIGMAFNLPVLAFEKHFAEVAPMLTPESPVVVYCDGTECELSHRLAKNLQQVGYTNVHMLYNGWTVWKQSGFPTEQGVRQ